MKVNFEADLTPVEARALMGLPDLTPVHDAYLKMVTDALTGESVRPEALEAMMRSWAPMSEAGMAAWRRLIESAAPK